MTMIHWDLIRRRRAFSLPGYCTLNDVDMDGDYVSPLQIISDSATGPVLLAFNWLDAESARTHHAVLRELGYLPGIPFNKVVDLAMKICGITRADIYMTQVFHLLPPSGRSATVPVQCLNASFQAITRFELVGRKVVALGSAASGACARHGITPAQVVDHPSARGSGRTVQAKAAQLAAAIRTVLC